MLYKNAWIYLVHVTIFFTELCIGEKTYRPKHFKYHISIKFIHEESRRFVR